MNAVRVLGPPCEHTAGRWIRGHALSASRPAIYNPFPLRLMTWSEQVEIMQITFPWKSLSLDPVRGVSLRARVSMFVFTSEGGGVSMEVMGLQLRSRMKQHFLPLTHFPRLVVLIELHWSRHPSLLRNVAGRAYVPFHLHIDRHVHMFASKGSMNK